MIILHDESSKFHSIVKKIVSEMELQLIPELDFCDHVEHDPSK